MLESARAKGVYRQLFVGDMRATPLPAAVYDPVTVSLADEHVPDLRPLCQEAAGIARPGSSFVLVGYHPYFLMMSGMLTHYHRASGELVTIETYVHLTSDHVQAATSVDWSLRQMHEGLMADEYLAHKPKRSPYRDRPISFALVWQQDQYRALSPQRISPVVPASACGRRAHRAFPHVHPRRSVAPCRCSQLTQVSPDPQPLDGAATREASAERKDPGERPRFAPGGHHAAPGHLGRRPPSPSSSRAGWRATCGCAPHSLAPLHARSG